MKNSNHEKKRIIMSIFLVQKIEKNINLITNFTDDILLEKVSELFLTKTEKEPVLFLIRNDKIPKTMTSKLFKFIIVNKYWDLFLELDYNKFDIHTDKDTAIIKSSEDGAIDVVKFLGKNGANVHACDNSALRWSSQNGHIDIVKFLVENGAAYLCK
jgi:ankyrin repeat protein